MSDEVEQRLAAAEERIAALERDRWDRAEFETRKHDFIRGVVIHLAAVKVGTEADPSTIWALAEALWDSKPEDC
jgi:hypothetical protein